VASAQHAAIRRIVWATQLDMSLERDHRGQWSLFSRYEEYVTAAHAKYFILELYKEFEDDLITVLDGAPYFQ
jgi:hypothetical protein